MYLASIILGAERERKREKILKFTDIVKQLVKVNLNLCALLHKPIKYY